MALNDIVNVQVRIAAATVVQAGFGMPLVYAHHNHWQDRVHEYDAATWQDALEDEGFTTDEPAYLAAAAMMKQSPRPKKFKIGRRATAETQILHIVPVVGVANQTHKLKIGAPDGTVYPIEFTADGTPTLAEIATGLASAINLTDVDMTADGSSGTHVVLTGDAANTLHEVYDLSSTLTLTDETVPNTAPGTGIAADLDAIMEEDNDWYALVPATAAPAALEACADWVELNPRRIMVVSTHDQGLVDPDVTDDLASSIQDQAYARSHVAYNSRSLSFMGAAWTAAMLTYEPGQATWMFKTLTGVYADKLTTDQESALEAKYSSYYQQLLGTNNSGDGKAGSGIFIDLTQLSDWASARTEEGVVAVLRAAPKVKFTDADAGNKFYGVCRNVIQMGIANDAIQDGEDTWTINIPKVADIPAIDRQNRKFTGIAYSFTATNAVHGVDTINIYVNV